MNLQEHIRKVLKENHTDKMIKLIDNYIKTFYPYFNSKDLIFIYNEPTRTNNLILHL